MGEIDSVEQQLKGYFWQGSGRSYIRLLDTPRVWGMPFGPAIMAQAWKRQGEFSRALEEVIQKARYRCDVSSLNCPDPDWAAVIIGAMDTALSTQMSREAPTQFRFLFGQTPSTPVGEPPNYTLFKRALIRLVRDRGHGWEMPADIWLGRFYRLREGVLSAVQAKVFGGGVWSDPDTKMTWNHSKIAVADGTEALVGGHNLNMDLFLSYPPVHDLSVVVHGPGAAGAQSYLNQLWGVGSDLLVIEHLDVDTQAWKGPDPRTSGPRDPLTGQDAIKYVIGRQNSIVEMHDQSASLAAGQPDDLAAGDTEDDLATLPELVADVFPLRTMYARYAALSEYRPATGMLALGKYARNSTDYQDGAAVMKKQLILNAKRTIKLSQMDLVSAWKKNWSDHVVCQQLLEALLANPNLTVSVVVSPLDAGAGAGGDQYSFGSGAARTFDLMRYYMTHDADSDTEKPDPAGARANALRRLLIAPLYYTDAVPPELTIEGDTYKWPSLPREGYTATLKQPSLAARPPSKGVIGSAALSVLNASGYIFKRVRSAPGNHAKLMIIDDEAYVVGSDNLYPGFLSEFDYLVEGKEAVGELLDSYWNPLWRYAGPHARTLDPAPARSFQAAVESGLLGLSTPPLQQVLFIGDDMHVHQFRRESRWWHSDLSRLASAPPASPAAGLVAPGTPQGPVCYAGTDGHLYRLSGNRGWNVGNWDCTDLTSEATGPVAEDPPLAAPAAGLATLSLPELPVYYIGVDGHVRVLWFASGVWWLGDLSLLADAPVLAATDGGLATLNGPQQVFYTGTDGHVHQLRNEGGWKHADLTEAADAPTAAGWPATADGTPQKVFYTGTDGHIHLLVNEGGWVHGDLSALTGAPPAAGAPAAQGDPWLQVCYTGPDGRVHLLDRVNQYSDWRHTDVTPATGIPAVPEGDLALLNAPVAQAFYVGADGHVYQLAYDRATGRWASADLTAATAP